MAQPMTVVARIQAKEGREELVRQELTNLMIATRAEEGCVHYALHQAIEDKRLFMAYENWASRRDWEAHMQTPHVQAVLAKAADLLGEAPEVTAWEQLEA